MSTAKVVTITNHGKVAVSISSSITGDFSKKTTTCGTSLPAAANCTISVTFKPTAIGTRTGVLTIQDSDPSSPQKVTLTGVGTAVSLSPSSLTFATQLVGTISAPRPISFKNYGTSTVTITGISTTGDFAQNAADNTFGKTVVAGATCTINVFFTPTAINSRTGTLSVSDNGGGSPQKVSLVGIGTVVILSRTSVNFGSQPVGTASKPQTIILTNHSGTMLSISGISITGTNSGDFSQINACGKSLSGGASCTIDVTFKPTAKGARVATLSISDDGGGSPQKVGLTGTGT